jgi:DNA mismatch repair protein MutS
MADDVTPIRQQYLEIKRQYPDAIVFFRLGDFYETFDEDAEITSRELDIVLTSRNVAKGVRIPMAGIPYHAVENYLGRLIDKGFHVAICEQVGAQPERGLFAREVVRVVTPGTVIEPALLKGSHNNYLAAVVTADNRAGVAYADITTGEFYTTELESSDILTTVRSELMRLQPAEILHPDTLDLANGWSGHLTKLPAWRFEPGRSQEMLLHHFSAGSLDGFGLRGKPLAVRAAGAILNYLQENQKDALKLLTSLATYTLDDFMVLDASTRRNLELTETIRSGETEGSLLSVLDHTVTPMGKRQMRQWVSKPLLNIKTIHTRQECVRQLLENGLQRADLRTKLKPLADLERITARVIQGSVGPRELVSLRATLKALPDIKQSLAGISGALGEIINQVKPC